MFRSKQLHKIHIFKHSRNFSQSQQYNENQAAIRIIKHTKTKYHVYQVTKKQECLRSKEQESTRQTSNLTSKQYILKKKEAARTMIYRDSKKWKSDKCNTFAYGFSIYLFFLFSNILINIYYSYISIY